MKPRVSTIQAKEFQADSLRRQLAQFDRMIGDLETIKVELGKQIDQEERRTGIADPENVMYSTVAKAARDRRDNLSATLDDLNERRARVVESIGDLESFFQALSAAEEITDAAPAGWAAA